MNSKDYREKLDHKLRRFRVALMNNTKWREVLYHIGKSEVEIRFSTVWEDPLSSPQQLINPVLHEYHLGDGCLVGGPLFYKEILELRVARFQKLRDSRTGAAFKGETRSQNLLTLLQPLGQLPLAIGDEEIILRAYL